MKKLVIGRITSQINDSEFNRLTNLEINDGFTDFPDEDLDQLRLFIERNKLNIRQLSVLYCEALEESEDCKNLLNSNNKLSNLIHLNLVFFKYGLNENSFVTHFNEIALNCKNIEELSVQLVLSF